MLIKYIDYGQAMTAADVEVVEIMRRRDFDGSRTFFGVRIAIGNNRDMAADEWKNDMPADKPAVALVIGMHRNGGVAEHGLRTRRGNGDAAGGIVGQRIVEVPELALGLNLLHLEIGNRGKQLRVPIDETLVLVDQAFPVKLHKDLDDRA